MFKKYRESSLVTREKSTESTFFEV